MDNVENENLFGGWVEHRYQYNDAPDKVIFWTKERYYGQTWVPAIVGTHRGYHHYKYKLADSFARKYDILPDVNQGMTFQSRPSLFAWLNEVMVQIPGDRWDYFTITFQHNEQGRIIGQPLPDKLIRCCERKENQIHLHSGARTYTIILETENTSHVWDTFLTDHNIKHGYTVIFIGCHQNAYDVSVYGPRNLYKSFKWHKRIESIFGLARAYQIEYSSTIASVTSTLSI